MGTQSGKLGEVVMYRSNGQQMARARVRTIANPQSIGQKVQRVVATTVARAYSGLIDICNHSFENKTSAADNMAEFMSLNMKLMRDRLFDYSGISWVVASNHPNGKAQNYIAPGQSYQLVPNPYIVSRGSLPKQTLDSLYASLLPATGQYTYAEWALGAGGFNIDTITYDQLISLLGLQVGDQLTFLGIQGEGAMSNDSFIVSQTGNIRLEYARVILSPSDGDTSKKLFVPEGTTGTAAKRYRINDPNYYNEGYVWFSQGDTDTLFFNVGPLKGIVDTVGLVAAGVIVSRKGHDGTWKRSNCQLSVNTAAIPAGYWTFANAEAEFEGITVNSDRYLNQANTATTSGE